MLLLLELSRIMSRGNCFRGSSLSDPEGLFNVGIEAKASRAIDVHEGHALNVAALSELVRAAVVLNDARPTRKGKP